MICLALFHTQSGAIKFQKRLAIRGIDAQMQPVPRKLSSSCGIAVRFDYDGEIAAFVSADVQEIYEIRGSEYLLLYSGE